MKKWLLLFERFNIIKGKNEMIFYEWLGDPFHGIGEILYRSIEYHRFINIFEDKEKTRKYANEEGVKITRFYQHYNEDMVRR